MGERRRRERRQEPLDISSGRRETERRLSERRRDKRVAAEVLVEVETTGRRTYRRTANISIGGVAFHAPIPFRKGSQINLTMRLVGRRASIRVEGEIVGVDKMGRGTRVRFSDLPTKARRTLEEHLDLFEIPTQIGVPPSPAHDPRDADKHRVREGLLIVDGDPEGREFRLRSSDKIIGRDPKAADFILAHPSVSRRHAQIYMQNDRHVIADLSSTNGVHFRNKPIHTLVLRDGMIFRVGKVRLQYLVTRAV